MSLNLIEIKDVFQKHESLTDNIMDRLREIWKEAKKHGFKEYEGGPEKFEFTEDFEKIQVQWYESWPYGGWDRGHISLPTNLLWEDFTPFFVEKKKIIDENIKKLEEKQRKDTEKSEKDLLKTLKNKYEK